MHDIHHGREGPITTFSTMAAATSGITTLVKDAARQFGYDETKLNLQKSNIQMPMDYTTQSKNLPKLNENEKRMNKAQMIVNFGNHGAIALRFFDIELLLKTMNWPDKWASTLSAIGEDKISMFRYDDPQSLYKCYTTTVRKDTLHRSLAREIKEFENHGWISSLKKNQENNTFKASNIICLVWDNLEESIEDASLFGDSDNDSYDDDSTEKPKANEQIIEKNEDMCTDVTPTKSKVSAKKKQESSSSVGSRTSKRKRRLSPDAKASTNTRGKKLTV